MQCLFCKADSRGSIAVEHIVPESMGNRDHVLPLGAVCDWCNNYFARKVERPVLESAIFRQLRAGMGVVNKKGRLPQWSADEALSKPSYRLMGRFLAKVALEVLAFKTCSIAGWNQELVEKRELDELREFARFNIGEEWPFTIRTLHPVNAVFAEGDETYELLHEFNIFLTPKSEAFLVLSLFGVEFVINLGGRELDGYRVWLEGNDYASPLYPCKGT